MIKYNSNDKILSNIARVVEKRAKRELNLTLVLDKTMDEFDAKYEDGVITSGSYHGVIEVCGRVLRNPNLENDTFHSHKELCGMYFASHNHNFYEIAPVEELCDYVEELALWGMNTIKMWFDMYYFEDMADGQWFVDKITKVLLHAKSIGVKIVLGILSNEAFRHSPEELRADWTSGHDGYIYNLNDHYHVEICPSVPGGMEKILEYRRQYIEAFRAVEPDFVTIGPYDEGGCSCKDCAPWGSNGYLRCVEALTELIREYWPKTEIIISTWQFGTFTGTNVEFEGMKKALNDGRMKEARYITAEPQYQLYPFEQGLPRPIIGFPEISMCETIPWGGYGTNPLPTLLQHLWDKNGDKLEGGWPYSEGYYEDINKVIVLRHYRDNQPAVQTVREYIAYEFGFEGEMLDKVHQAVMDMEHTFYRTFEKGHKYVPKEAQYLPEGFTNPTQPELIPEIEKVILEADALLPEEIKNGPRWQMIYLRAVIDGELCRNNYTRNDKVLECFNKIVEVSHLEKANRHVKPDVYSVDLFARDYTPEEMAIIAAGGKVD